jgi:hypothetical protein
MAYKGSQVFRRVQAILEKPDAGSHLEHTEEELKGA